MENLIVTQAIVIFLLPLAAFVIQIFLGRRLPRQGDWLPTSVMFVGLILAVLILGRVLANYDPAFKITRTFEWMKIGPLVIRFGILIDNLTAAMLFVVTLISALVHLYSIGYMHGDVRYSRYFAYLALFSFSMLGLVLVDNFFAIYIFWELVGVCSYLLIGHWFEKKSASDAAVKAFITTRIGDLGMFAGILIIFATLGTFGFEEVFSSVAAGKLSGGLLTLTGILVFFGAIGKSAQFPLHVWLPDAMEGPTPVSALIHAATMVAAGVYLVGRTYLLYSADALLFIAMIGTITAFIAATIAIAQVDIKKVLAYSTVSQLGYMIAALGVGGYTAGLFHLMTHAYFKALLFLGSGSVIHAMHHAYHQLNDHHSDPQDMRNMGGLRSKLPVTFVTMLAATCAISGVPLFSGFFTKDAILGAALEKAATSHDLAHWLIAIVLFVSAGITAFYMFRLIYMTFFGQPARREILHHATESPSVMTVPLIVLGVFSVIGGYGSWFKDLVVKPELANYAAVALAPEALHETGHEAAHTAHTMAMWLSILIAGTGILLSTAFYYWKKFSADAVAQRYKPIYNFLWKKWYFDDLYAATVLAGTHLFSRISGWFDLKVIDGLVDGAARVTVFGSWLSGEHDNRIIDGLVNLTARIVGWFGGTLREVQTGRVQSYILMALGAVVLLYILQLAFA
ncbi:MAG: NADH-quinone oxidoreductase subunit L [candidate division KSB1 bacterium]|nr:NADH-quinone oxidoreductase subunit L [candidate division KSB1 bacterium]MDZ7302102.1 NADH-quinone oxidoreductase subunit L [candidate division KSB1 bacterium]MDZ7311143.1 NADH-quinone oxidoreductase subunit L [candidate division KSB1 bacterium]